MLAVVQNELAADHDVVDAGRALDTPRRAVRAVAGDLVLLHAELPEVEDHEVRHHALAHEPSIVETYDARGLEGEPADRVFQREVLPVAHPLAEHVGRLARGAEVRVEMRAGVRLRGN